MSAVDPRDAAATLLHDERMRLACLTHDLRTVFLLLRARGVSYRALGEATGLGAGRAHEYTNGARRAGGFGVIEKVSDGLRIPGHMLRLADRVWEQPESGIRPIAESSASPSDLWVPSCTVEAVSDFTRKDLMLSRRETNKSLGTLLVGTPLVESVERWIHQDDHERETPPRPGIGREELEQIEHSARVFRDWDEQYGGGLRRKAVVGQLSEVSDILRESHSADVRRRLFAIMGKLAETAAIMSWDSGYQARAQRYYLLGLRASKAGGDVAFGANVLASMARQLLYLDRPSDALELVRLAQEGSVGRLSARVEAMLYTREAWAYARLGRVQAFRRATGKAEEAFSRADNTQDPYWISYFSKAELAGVTGGRLLDLAESDVRFAEEAKSYISRAIDDRQRGSARSHALDQAGLAVAHLRTGDLEHAAKLGSNAINVANKTHSDRVHVKLASLYKMTVPHARARPAQELREHLREYLTS